MRRVIAVVLGVLASGAAAAEELVVRNIGLVRAGHLINIVGTVYNTADHAVDSTYMAINVVDRGKVIAREVVKVPPLEAGQAWRLTRPIGAPAQAAVAQADSERLEGPTITVDTRKFPHIVVGH
jgi:hypothetical protein